MKRLTAIDLFCGAGGLSKGFEMAGFEILLGVDFDKNSIDTFNKNHPHAETYVGNISNLGKNELIKLIHGKKINLVCGGPPCQGMSTVGEGIPDDSRNFLFREFLRIVKILKPDYVVMENVTGMVCRKNEKILRAILKEFGKIGYKMNVRVLQASDYGIPQKRRRTIFIGNRLGYENIFPNITHGNRLENVKTVGDALCNLKALDGNVYNHDKNAVVLNDGIDIERLKHIPEGLGIRYENDERKFLPKNLWLDVNWNAISEGRFRQTKYQRLDRKKPSPTIMTSRHSYFHPTENRYLTPREVASIQSFPNDFIFSGAITQQFKQIGNAVPPLLAKSIGEAILRMHVEKKKSNGEKNEISKIRYHAFNYKDKELSANQPNMKKVVER